MQIDVCLQIRDKKWVMLGRLSFPLKIEYMFQILTKCNYKRFNTIYFSKIFETIERGGLITKKIKENASV